ncbi:MAG: NAD(P)-dependent oxidoreductase [Caulobacterales bacterium]
MDAFPAFFPLAGRRVVIAGEGDLADAKARLFDGSPATVERIAGARALTADSYAGAALAFVSSPDRDFVEAAAAAARAAHVPLNVVDHPALCDFHTPALIDRGEVVAAIGTTGGAPILASLLRADIEARLPEGTGRIAALLRRFRGELREAYPDLAQRRAFLRSALDGPPARAALAGDTEEAARLLRAALAAGGTAAGRLWLIEIPSAPDLLSLRSARALSMADILVSAKGADRALLVLARRDATRIVLDEAVELRLTAWVGEGRQVVVVAPAAQIARIAAAAGDLPRERLAPAGAA